MPNEAPTTMTRRIDGMCCAAFLFAGVIFGSTPTTAAAHAQDTPGFSDDLLTIAEASDYTRTATYDEVVSLMDRIAAESSIVHRMSLGTTHEGRSIPVAVVADPPVRTVEEARASGKLIIFAFGNIHAGEVCGKEALLQLLRTYALPPDAPELADVILVFAPIYNADGNERFAPVDEHRPGQAGPASVGIRANAQGLDLNRDYMKLEAPETRALVRFLNEWDPHITIDLHTTNGSRHRYTLTYAAPQNPSGFEPSIRYIRDTMLPAISEALRERSGYETFFYGNFNRDLTVWATYSHQPRFGAPYRGLRGQMSILSEAYSYAPFRDRVICSREFCRLIFEHASRHADEIRTMHERARTVTVAQGRNPQPGDTVGIRHRIAAFPGLTSIKGYEMEDDPDRRRPRATDTPIEHKVVHLGRFEPTHSVSRPWAYLLEPGHPAIIEKLRQHGVKMTPFTGQVPIAETYTIDEVSASRRPFEGHTILSVDATASRAPLMVTSPASSPEASWWLIPTGQPLGNLIVYLLEPASDDGLTAWNLWSEGVISAGATYPVRRVPFPMAE